jgi:hypothetical protein
MATQFQDLKNTKRFRIRGEIKWRYFGAANDDPKNTVKHLTQEQREIFVANYTR